MKPYAERLRQVLQAHPDGMSVAAMCAALNVGRGHSVIYQALRRMPDTYIDRWEPARDANGRAVGHRAVWCAVDVPANCPRPRKK